VIESGSRVVRSGMGVLSYTLRGFDVGVPLVVGAVAVVVGEGGEYLRGSADCVV
jgi:hypothetical protein